MNKLNSTAIAALLTAAVALTAVAPASAAQTTSPSTVTKSATDLQVAENSQGWGQHRQNGPRAGHAERGQMGDHQRDNQRGGQQRGPGGLMGIFAFERGAEALEIAFVRLSHDITLTDAQKPLFDDLKTTALTAQTEFADALKAARPAAPSATATADATTAKPDIATMLKTRIAIETAHTKALSAVLPKLEAFTASLTDEQKAELLPQRPDGAAMNQRDGGMHRHGRPGQDMMAPGADMAPPAPPADDVAPPADAPAAPAING